MDNVELSRGKTLSFEQDADYESPREWDNLGTFVGDHNRYNIFDKKASDLREVCAYICTLLQGVEKTYAQACKVFDRIGTKEDAERFMDRYAFWLPVYMYDHSGQTIATTPFSCPWDSGQIGYIFITKEKYKKEFGVSVLTKKQCLKAEWILKEEIRVLDTYIRGDVFGVVLKDKDGEVMESCWGFYGDNILLSGALDCIEVWVSKEDVKRIKREVPRYDRVEYRAYRNLCSYFYPKRAKK